jgi:hypothetical protein
MVYKAVPKWANRMVYKAVNKKANRMVHKVAMQLINSLVNWEANHGFHKEAKNLVNKEVYEEDKKPSSNPLSHCKTVTSIFQNLLLVEIYGKEHVSKLFMICVL